MVTDLFNQLHSFGRTTSNIDKVVTLTDSFSIGYIKILSRDDL